MFVKLLPILSLMSFACTPNNNANSDVDAAAVKVTPQAATKDITPAACTPDADTPITLGFQDAVGIIRLSLCTNYDTTYINQLVLRRANVADIVLGKTQVVKQEKLSESLFGDASGLVAELGKGVTKITISGNSAGVWNFVLSDGKTISGILDYSDPFSPCFRVEGGANYGTKDLLLGTAKLRLHLCTGAMSTSGGYAYNIIGADIADKNPKLPKTINVKLSGSEFKKNVNIKINHHNICDSVVIRLPQATYAMTSVGGVPEGDIGISSIDPKNCSNLPEAPKISKETNGKYIIKYGTVITEGNLLSPNYFN